MLIVCVTFAPSAEAHGRKPGIQGESKGGHKDEIDILSAQANECDAIVAEPGAYNLKL